jgi:hypothetical protein
VLTLLVCIFTPCPCTIQLVDQNSSLKKEAGIAERKLLARNERIQNLEALLQDADRRLSVQNQKFEAQLAAVKERLDQARGERCFLCVWNRLTIHNMQHKKLLLHRHLTLAALRNH